MQTDPRTELKQPETMAEWCKKRDIRCDICGEQSVVFDSWFSYYPCKNHSHLSPTEYSDVLHKMGKR